MYALLSLLQPDLCVETRKVIVSRFLFFTSGELVNVTLHKKKICQMSLARNNKLNTHLGCLVMSCQRPIITSCRAKLYHLNVTLQEKQIHYIPLASNDNSNTHLDCCMLCGINQGACHQSQMPQLSQPRDTDSIRIIGVTEKVATANADALEPWARAMLGVGSTFSWHCCGVQM